MHEYAVERLGATPIEVKLPSDLDIVQGLIIPGGESTTMSILLATSELIEPMSKLIEDGLPVFGTCAGMILLASNLSDGRSDQISLGAIDISVQRNAFGRQPNSFECDLSVAKIGLHPFRGVFIRAPLVYSVGRDVEVLSRLSDERGASPVLCKQDNILVGSFHPELTGDDRIHKLFLSMVYSQ
ncbi:MAG: pyridoxal 5'-phosphate synthase glutaminase subunit PdxT [Actinobacteria bacterium]|nr:pyridoxal 5'-phosphate synthase glutaminase subunit PdxT [Actinomycetota bacterium]MCL6105528.1 pyridoxal 5'-phosphate synthase glutaminase subunit PdxT [Actinomycetota bacterium]